VILGYERFVDAAVMRKFLSLIACVPISTLLQLYNYDHIANKVYVFNYATKSVTSAADAENGIAWPVVWLLATHHRKHICCSRQLPSMDLLRQSIKDVVCRIQWTEVDLGGQDGMRFAQKINAEI